MQRNRHILAAIVATMLAACAPRAAAAPAIVAAAAVAGPASRPTKLVALEDCVTSDCHANIKSSRIVHGPVAVDACDACHELTSVSKHTYKISRDKQELCTYCHEFSVAGMNVVHEPVKRGECLGCHDPHGGATHDLVREDSTPALCARCHEPVTRGRSFLHGPVEQGACLSCHSPHAARFANLLDAAGPDLCLTCHVDFENRMSRVKFTHAALDEGCRRCHDPHGSSSPNSTTQPVQKQCTGCHAPVAHRAAGATVKHSPLTDARSCMNCHTPHGSDVAALMSDLPASVCLKCHAEPIRTGGKVAVAAMKELADPQLFKHGDIRQGECSGCHESHGASRPALLDKVNSTAFYQRFSIDQYELCFACHDRRLVTEPTISAVTSFRDGERNLHYVHVATGKRSHSCRACHDPHVGSNPAMLRDRIAFGIWQLPMRFRQTATGGTCAPGCHVAYSYDRVNPLGATTRPIDPATIITARAGDEIPLNISFSATDTSGRTVNVPDAARDSVVIFLGDGARANDELLGELNVALRKSPAPAQVVLVSPRAQETQPIDDAAVIVDAAGTMRQQLEIRGWPVVMLVRPDGTVAARFGGAGQVLAMKLAAYLAPAATTQSADSSDVQTITGGRRTRASRDAQVARDLIRQGKPADAAKLLAASIDADPESTPLKLAMIEALADLKRTDEAVSLLDRLPPGAIWPAARDTLRARILIAAGKWDAARAPLESAIAADANLAEAHQLLGQVYEHAGEWQRAAAEYRTAGELSRQLPPVGPSGKRQSQR